MNHSLFLLVIGVILLDLAVQAVHVTNQSMLFTVRPEARSRLTASYMIFILSAVQQVQFFPQTFMQATDGTEFVY